MKVLKITIAALLVGLLFASVAAAHDSKVGFVNPQRIINETRIGRIAQEDLSNLGQEKDRRVRDALDIVDAIRSKLDNPTISPTEETDIEKALRLSIRDYEQLVEASNMDIQGEERRLIQFVMQQADAILRKVALERGFTMILTDPEIIGFVSDSMDVTDRVIRELDSML